MADNVHLLTSVFWHETPPRHRPLLEVVQYSGVLSRLLSTSFTVRLLVFLSTLGLETRLNVGSTPKEQPMFVLLSIPNGPAGLLVSVNEEPVHAIGILLLFLTTFAEGQHRSQTHS